MLIHVWLVATPWTIACSLLCSWNSLGKNFEVGSHSLHQGIFMTQGLNLRLLHCRQILYRLSYQGMPMVVIEMPNCYKNFIHLLSVSVSVNGTPLQYSCLENPMDGGAWWAAVHGVAKSRTQLRDFTFSFHLHALEKEMATRSSVLGWRIPGWSPVGYRLWGCTESDTTEAISSSSSSYDRVVTAGFCSTWT